MTTQINDGGPAFPSPRTDVPNRFQSDGMSLRDLFAGMAMSSFMQTAIFQEQMEIAIRKKVPNGEPEERQRIAAGVIAKRSYQFADAMLRRRAGEVEPGVTP